MIPKAHYSELNLQRNDIETEEAITIGSHLSSAVVKSINTKRSISTLYYPPSNILCHFPFPLQK